MRIEDNIKHLMSVFNQYGEIRLVGGYVRDLLIGKINDDIDLATNLLPAEIIAICNQHNFKYIDIASEYGTIIVIYQSVKFELTTLRQDIENYGRAAKVNFCQDWQQDSNRRDLSINAIYMDIEGRIYDYHNGEADLKSGIIRFIGDARQRIIEDKLRILRFFRFYAIYGKQAIAEEYIQLIREYSPDIVSLSKERVTSEFIKILACKSCCDKVLPLLFDSYLLQDILQYQVKKADIYAVSYSDDLLANLCYLQLISHDKNHDKNHLRLSKKQQNNLATLHRLYHECDINSQINHSEIIRKFNKAIYNSYLKLHSIFNLDTAPYYKLYQDFAPPILPVTAQDIMQHNISGRNISLALKQAEKIWVDSHYKITKASLLAKCLEYINQESD